MRSPGHLRAKIGRRGIFLLFLCLLDLLYGTSILSDPNQLAHLHLVLCITGWGWWWIVTGIACFIGAFMEHDRIPFSLAAFLKAAWAAAWLDVWLSDAIVPRAWVSSVIWAAFAGVVMVVASWPEVRRTPPPTGAS